MHTGKRKTLTPSFGSTWFFVEHFRFDGTRRPSKPTREKKMDIDWSSFVEIWKKRKEAIDAAAQTSLFTSPSAIADKEKIPQTTFSKTEGIDETSEVYPQYAAIIGTICHRVLEAWDFHGSPQELQRSVESAVKWAITLERIKGESSGQFQGEGFPN